MTNFYFVRVSLWLLWNQNVVKQKEDACRKHRRNMIDVAKFIGSCHRSTSIKKGVCTYGHKWLIPMKTFNCWPALVVTHRFHGLRLNL